MSAGAAVAPERRVTAETAPVVRCRRDLRGELTPGRWLHLLLLLYCIITTSGYPMAPLIAPRGRHTRSIGLGPELWLDQPAALQGGVAGGVSIRCRRRRRRAAAEGGLRLALALCHPSLSVLRDRARGVGEMRDTRRDAGGQAARAQWSKRLQDAKALLDHIG